MILSDVDIIAAVATERIGVNPPPAAERYQPASLELCLSDDFRAVNGAQLVLTPGGEGEPPLFFLARGMFVLATTVETVTIPPDLVAQVNGKSTWARRGLIVHTTAGFIDPGFTGQVTLELANLSGEDLYLPVGTPICQLVFYTMTSPALRPYGSEGLGSHYQGQQGTTNAKA